MNPPDSSWPTLITAAIGAIVAGMIAYGNWKSGKREAAQKQENLAIQEGHREVLKAVNGPLGVLMASHATALERIARSSELPADILAADAARKASDKHNIEMEASEAAAARNKAADKKIIDDFLDKTTPGA